MYFQSPDKNSGGRSQHINHHNFAHQNITPKNSQMTPVRHNPIGMTPTNRMRNRNHSHNHHNASHSF